MKRLGMLLGMTVLAASILTGCVVVPWGWDGDGGYHHHGYYHEDWHDHR